MTLANFTSPSPTDIWTPNIYAIIKDVWVLQYRDQLRLDEYFIMQSTKAKLLAKLDHVGIAIPPVKYSIIFKGDKWEISEMHSRWLLSFRANRTNNFAVVLAKPVNEAYGCPDYKHFPVGS